MHVLGFWHEHSRPDRDVFVTVQYNNVAKESKHNFKRLGKGLAKSLDSPYDLSSIMHFNGYSFSTNSMPTILDKNGNTVTAQRSDLSKEDIAEINQLYQCVITPNMDG
uniref:Metalloendopeptidase n=1 Tax=Phallusia mammillata TaxID=59560 RepID=A0A6F9DMN8_9ASCI|nr:high choriolytic enzyme 1-like [Phallusia mammillata]